MKYILLASLLTTSVIAAPFFGQGQGRAGNDNAKAAKQPTKQQQGAQGTAQGAQTGTQGVQSGAAAAVQSGSAAAAQNGGAQGVQNGGANVGAQKGGANTGAQAGTATDTTPSAADLATAVSNWMADTSMVSNFLNIGPTIQNDVQFKQAATVAFNAEVDELTHKAVIDAANGADPNVVAANSTLATGGSFQDVVDRLQQMSVQGKVAVGNIDLINQNRCVNVLPNIDAYMKSTGSTSRAVRPTVCDETGVAGGVQGTGPTQPGAQPGTPAAAFAAAKAVAGGAGNGAVQNGAGTAAPQGQQQAGNANQQQGTAPAAAPAAGFATQATGNAASTVPSQAAQQQAGAAQNPAAASPSQAAQQQTGGTAGGNAGAKGQTAGKAGAGGRAGAAAKANQ